MSGAISFQTIPPNLRIPLVSVEFDPSNAGVNQFNQVTLLIGQTLYAQPLKPVNVSSPAQAQALFKAGSILSRMYEAYTNNDSLGTVWCLPLPDAIGGVAATGTITIAGPATAAGTIALYVAGQPVPVAVNVGDTATIIATNIVAAINAMLEPPVLATSSAGVVTLTSRHVGLLGNAIDLRLNYYGLANGEQNVSGVTVTIVAMSGGTLDPDFSQVAAVLGDQPFDFIVHPYTSSAALVALTALLNNTTGRWGPLRQVYGHAFGASRVTGSNSGAAVTSLLTFSTTINDPHQTIMGYYDSPTPPWEVAAAFAGAAAPALRAAPSRPLQTLTMTGFLAPPVTSRFTNVQAQSLLTNGIALPRFAQDGTASIMRAVTTYEYNSYGQPDESYLDSETLFTLMAITRQLSAAITQKFPRAILAADGTRFGPGQPVVTPSIMKAEIVAQYATMEINGLVQDADAMAQQTVCLLNDNDPSRMDILWVPTLTNGLRIVAIKNQFALLQAMSLAA